jgi:hypothetical protein
MNAQWQPGQVELSMDVSALPLNQFVRDASAYPEYQSSIENLITEPIQAITQTVTASYTPTNTEYNNYTSRVNEYTNSPSQNTPPYIDIELYVWIALLIAAFILVGYNVLIYTSRNRT